MDREQLAWSEEGRKTVFTTPIFQVTERYCRPPAGGKLPDKTKTFFVLDSREYGIIIPVLNRGSERVFVMVRQWRHGSCQMSLEFPGGIIENGEALEAGALRELWEETGYRAGRITRLATMSPNPAIMSNHAHFFLAEDLQATGKRELDEDEFVDVELIPAGEVIANMGTPPYIHSLMAAALSFYTRSYPLPAQP